MCSFFKTLVEHEITVELKNEVQIRGTLKSVDQYLNIKLDNAEAVDEMRWPHLVRQFPMVCRFGVGEGGGEAQGRFVSLGLPMVGEGVRRFWERRRGYGKRLRKRPVEMLAG